MRSYCLCSLRQRNKYRFEIAYFSRSALCQGVQLLSRWCRTEGKERDIQSNENAFRVSWPRCRLCAWNISYWSLLHLITRVLFSTISFFKSLTSRHLYGSYSTYQKKKRSSPHPISRSLCLPLKGKRKEERQQKSVASKWSLSRTQKVLDIINICNEDLMMLFTASHG